MFAYVNLHGVFHLIENKKQEKTKKMWRRSEEVSYKFNISHLVVKLPLFVDFLLTHLPGIVVCDD